MIHQTTGYDARYYYDGEAINSWVTQEENHYFPSCTHILSKMSPEEPSLTKWKMQNTNWPQLLDRSAIVGTYVHNAIEEICIKGQFSPSEEDFMQFSDEEVLKINRSIQGFIDWIKEKTEEDPDFKILKTEQRMIADGYAGTVDLLIDYKREKAKKRHTYVVDFKTSKAISEKHKIQVEAYRRAEGADFGIVLRLGSQRANCKRYTEDITLTKKKQDSLWAEFEWMMKGYYLKNDGKVKPVVEDFPVDYKINKSIIKLT